MKRLARVSQAERHEYVLVATEGRGQRGLNNVSKSHMNLVIRSMEVELRKDRFAY